MAEIDHIFNIIDGLTELTQKQGDALYRQSLEITAMKKSLWELESKANVAMKYLSSLDWCRGCDNYHPKGSVDDDELCESCHEKDKAWRAKNANARKEWKGW